MNTEDSVDYFALQDRVAELEKQLENAVEVVRCKDCKHKEDCSKNIAMRETYEMYEEIEWCSYGERRE